MIIGLRERGDINDEGTLTFGFVDFGSISTCSNGVEIKINRYDDEYYVVSLTIKCRESRESMTEYFVAFFECDQIDGIKKLNSDIIEPKIRELICGRKS